MKLYSPPPQLISSNNTGIQGGAWVGESHYAYNFFRKDEFPEDIAFFIQARLNLEFEAGGSIEYICRITHIFTLQENDTRPILMEYIILASKTAETLNKFFIEQDYMDDDGVNVWVQEDMDTMAPNIGNKLNEFYNSFSMQELNELIKKTTRHYTIENGHMGNGRFINVFTTFEGNSIGEDFFEKNPEKKLLYPQKGDFLQNVYLPELDKVRPGYVTNIFVSEKGIEIKYSPL